MVRLCIVKLCIVYGQVVYSQVVYIVVYGQLCIWYQVVWSGCIVKLYI